MVILQKRHMLVKREANIKKNIKLIIYASSNKRAAVTAKLIGETIRYLTEIKDERKDIKIRIEYLKEDNVFHIDNVAPSLLELGEKAGYENGEGINENPKNSLMIVTKKIKIKKWGVRRCKRGVKRLSISMWRTLAL